MSKDEEDSDQGTIKAVEDNKEVKELKKREDKQLIREDRPEKQVKVLIFCQGTFIFNVVDYVFS